MSELLELQMLGLYYEPTLIDEFYYGPEECYPGIIYSEKLEVKRAHFCILDTSSNQIYDVELYKQKVGDHVPHPTIENCTTYELVTKAFFKVVQQDTRDKITRIPRPNIKDVFTLPQSCLDNLNPSTQYNCNFFRCRNGFQPIVKIKEKNFTDKI